MLKKLISLMLVCSMFAVSAHAASQNGLKAAFDELNYSLVVEWDQKDKDFYTAQMKKFMGTVRELQAQGLTNAQLLDFVKSEVKDARVAKDLETAFNMISINKMSSEDATKFMVESMKRSYSNGASWNGDVLLYLGVGLLVVAAAIALSGASTGGGVSNGGGGYYCTDTYICDSTCYYDYYWGYTCYDDCYWTCY